MTLTDAQRDVIGAALLAVNDVMGILRELTEAAAETPEDWNSLIQLSTLESSVEELRRDLEAILKSEVAA